jgi:4-hydroxy-tetrahydrodipicolinate reductase
LKVSLIGSGKTGAHVERLILQAAPTSNWQLAGVYNRSHNPLHHRRELSESDAIIAFVPGNSEGAQELVEFLATLNVPIISGITGYEFSQTFKDNCASASYSHIPCHWVQSSNFSLLMSIVKGLIESLAHSLPLLGHNPNSPVSVALSETHHIHKKDAPSGTALSWQEWFNQALAKEIARAGLGIGTIESVREGDVVGVHQLIVSTPFEELTLRHSSKDRALFAEGALWCANYIHTTLKSDPTKLPSGFYLFEDIVKKFLNIKK